MTRPLILGTAGHIDHGKTALIKALTGVDTDRLPEEKKRGITIDIGFAHLELDAFNVGIVDVPGHEKFIRNMLAGAAGIDAALFVVAADDSVMPQTREHLAILELLNINHGVIGLTKCDLPDSSWTDLVEDEVRELVGGTFLQGAPIVRTSARTGEGIDSLRRALSEVFQRVEIDREDEPFRLAVDRSFVLEGLGTIVTGTVWSGSAHVGDEIEWMPLEKRIRIRGLQSHGHSVQSIQRGQRAAVHLANVHHTEIHRGHELAEAGYLKASRRLTVRIRALEDSTLPIKHRSRLRLHLGTREVISTVALLESNIINPGDSQLAQLHCADPITAVYGQPFVVRAESPVTTLGGGTVLQTAPERISRRSRHLIIPQTTALESTDPAIRIEAFARLAGSDPWESSDLWRETGTPPESAKDLLRQLVKSGRFVNLTGNEGSPDRLVHVEWLQEIEKHILSTVKDLHEESPLELTVPFGRLRAQIPYLDAEVLDSILKRMLDAEVLAGDARSFGDYDFKPALDEIQMKARVRILSEYEARQFMPPDVAILCEITGLNVKDLKPVLQLCTSFGELVHIGAEIFLHRNSYRELLEIVRKMFEQSDSITVSDLREKLNSSRKFAIPICEHLDRIGFTKRRGHDRVPGPRFDASSTSTESKYT